MICLVPSMLLRDRTLHRLAALRAAVPKSAEEEQRRKEAATTRCGDDGPIIEASPGPGAASAELLAAPAAPTLALRITLGTAKRAAASGTGARPKAAIDGPAAEERRRRQEEERKREEFEEMQTYCRLKTDADESPELRDEEEERDEGSREDKRRARLEEKRKREEWRKAWKQEKKRKEEDKQRERQARQRHEERSRVGAAEQEEDSDIDDPRKRAKMWGALNRDVRTILPKTTIQGGRGPGQISDADLDLRLRSRSAGSPSERLMSEAEVLAKLQKDRAAR